MTKKSSLKEKLKPLIEFKYLRSREYICICVFFFWAFFFFESVNMAILLYFEELNQNILQTAFVMTNDISLIVMPMLIVKLTSRFHRKRVLQLALLIFGIIAIFLLVFPQSIYAYIFTFPLVKRFINNTINPQIIKQAHGKSISSVFAIRDFALNIGISLGMLMSFLFRKNNVSYDSILKWYILIIIPLFILTFFMFDMPKASINVTTSEDLINEKVKEEQSKSQITKFKDLINKKNVIILLVIDICVTWIGVSLYYLGPILENVNFDSTLIYQSFGVGYLLVSFISLILTITIPKHHHRRIYLFDLIFDVFPICLIIFGNTIDWLIYIAVVLFVARDSIAPISSDFIYSCLDPKEIDYFWSISASIPSLMAILLNIPAQILRLKNPLVPLWISLGCALIAFLMALKWLPSEKSKLIE